jgi:hypothetical protein
MTVQRCLSSEMSVHSHYSWYPSGDEISRGLTQRMGGSRAQGCGHRYKGRRDTVAGFSLAAVSLLVGYPIAASVLRAAVTSSQFVVPNIHIVSFRL